MHIHVFTIDILPGARIVSSGGSLRSAQIIDGLRAAGAEVTYSVPLGTDASKDHWDKLTAEERENAFSIQPSSREPGRNHLDIVNRFSPDAVVYLWPSAFTFPRSTKRDIVSVLDMNGFQNVESALVRSASVAQVTTEYLNKIACGDILLAGSDAQRAYWSGLYCQATDSMGGLNMVELPFCPPLPPVKDYGVGEPTFFAAGSFLPWNSPEGHLEVLAGAIRDAGRGKLVVVGRANPMLPHAAAVNAKLRDLKRDNFVDVRNGMPYEAFSAMINGTGIGIDLHTRTFEREFAIPIRTVTFLAHGVPMITSDYSTLSAEIGRYGAGWQVNADNDVGFRDAIQEILGESDTAALQRRSAQSRRLVAERFDTKAAFASLINRIQEKRHPRSPRTVSAKPMERSSFLRRSVIRRPVVLIITDDHENFLQLRIKIPFDALYKAGHIGGYVVLRLGKVLRRVGNPADLDKIDIVWVQRGPTSSTDLVHELFSGRFIYDIDDNLLVSPSYRKPFSAEWREVIVGLLASASVITTTTPRLVDSLQRHSGVQIEHKVILAPNMTDTVTPRQFSGPPEALLLAASDSIPLIGSRAAFLSAVNRFCEGRQMPLLYLGTDANSFPELTGEVVTTGFLDYDAYRGLLRNENVMAVAPLEKKADFLTTEFISSKSDIKMVEFGAAGIPGVYSDAAPYADSPLEVGPLVDCGDERAVIDALERVCDDADRISQRAMASVASLRLADKIAVDQWGQAIEIARLPFPISINHVLETVQALRDTGSKAVAVPEELFNEADYLAMNPDAAVDVGEGRTTAYLHYVTNNSRASRPWFPGGTGSGIVNMNLSRYRGFILNEPGRVEALEKRLRK